MGIDGAAVARARKARGMSRQALADECGIALQALAALETGQTGQDREETESWYARKLAEVLEVSVAALQGAPAAANDGDELAHAAARLAARAAAMATELSVVREDDTPSPAPRRSAEAAPKLRAAWEEGLQSSSDPDAGGPMDRALASAFDAAKHEQRDREAVTEALQYAPLGRITEKELPGVAKAFLDAAAALRLNGERAELEALCRVVLARSTGPARKIAVGLLDQLAKRCGDDDAGPRRSNDDEFAQVRPKTKKGV
jgi:transcriptional regulator with XRE-family HTH domain